MTEKPQLKLYNSLTRQKEVFTPQDPKRVTMYNCGPTVYSYAHVGNARAAVVADVLFRVLRHIYGEDHVVYARNITDVDDRIIQSAKETGKPISDITEKFARIYNEDLAAIGCLPPTEQPKCTAHIDNMAVMISQLLEKGFAYESDGHVFFDVSKYEDYGKLSGNNLESLRGGDRVGEGEVARKRNSADFVLWKPELDGVGWDAPFGKGRPGWHIECSAMAKAVLTDGTDSDTIDIHCGGIDLKFPHHENEIAQSNCAHDGAPLANYWVHNEFLNMGSEKMSKSVGNVKLINDLIKDWDGEVIRLALLKAHYRSELVWKDSLLIESRNQIAKWKETHRLALKRNLRIPSKTPNSKYIDNANLELQLLEAIRFDLLTPAFFSIFKGIASNLRTSLLMDDSTIISGMDGDITWEYDAIEERNHWYKSFMVGANLLGLLQKDPEEWFRGGVTDEEDAEIDALILERAQAKADKNWARSDEIRDALKAKNIVLEDGADGTTWRRG